MDDDANPEDLYDAPYVDMTRPAWAGQRPPGPIGTDSPLTSEEREILTGAVSLCPDIKKSLREMTTAELRALVRMSLILEKYEGMATLPDAIADELQALNLQLGFDPRSEVEWTRHIARARAQFVLDLDVRKMCPCNLSPRSMTNPPLAQKAGTGDPPGRYADTCAEAILTTEPVELPDHICYDVLEESTAWFAGDLFPPPDRHDTRSSPRLCEPPLWHLTWPLPVGERSMARFARAHWLKRSQLPEPMFTDDPDAEVGLWVERHLEDGVVRLLGLIARDHEAQQVGAELLHFVEACIEKVPVPKRYRGSIPRRDPLQEMALELDRWYHSCVLGKRFPRAGRPPGPPSGFHRVEAPAYQRALDEMRRSRITPTFQGVATVMSTHLDHQVQRTTLQYWVKNGWLPPLPRRWE